jgi:hypothetical protein
VKRVALFFALLAATAAQAQQVFRCVDARGKTYYSEAFAPGCKRTGIESTPEADAAAKKAAAAKAAAAKAAAKAEASPPTGPNVKQSGPMPLTAKAHCDGLSNEAARLMAGKSGLPPETADMRLSGIQKELKRSCGR